MSLINFDPAERAVIEQAARDSLYAFTRWMFIQRRGYKWLKNWHHEAICDALTRVFNGECKRLIINVPPRYSKTEIAVINFIAWTLGQYPDAEFIHTSYSSRLAANNTWQVRELVQSAEYQPIFPSVQLRADSKARDEWRTTAGGVVYATGSGGTITGYGAGKHRKDFGGCIIIDDPHKADEATSDTIRNGVIEWFQNTLESRKNSPDTPIILIMQRLHESDLAGWLLDGNNGEEWEHVCLSAIQDDGSALWPDKHSINDLRRMEQASPYVFAGQYRQRPAPPEGGIIKPDNISIVQAIPAGTHLLRGWDFAASEKDGDFTAGGQLGVMPDGRWIICDMVRFQGGPHKVEAALVNTAKRDGDTCKISIPQDPGQAGKSQTAYFTKALAGFSVMSSPESGNKITRAEPLAAQINVGNVVMLKGEWNTALINEMRMFPNGKYDDQIDALSRAFASLQTNSFGLLDWMREQAGK